MSNYYSAAYNLTIEQGADNHLSFKHQLTDFTDAKLQIRKRAEDPVLLELSVSNGKIVIEPTICTLIISKADTFLLEDAEYDLLCTVGLITAKILRGKIKVIKAITQ